MKVAAHPGLYDPNEPRPVLRGTRCESCGTAFFPPLGIGCEVCGALAERLQPVALAAAGVLHSVATVHLYGGNDIAAPFTLAEIQLDDGPLIRGTLAEVAEIDVIGRRVEARWALLRTESDGSEVVEPRFTLRAETESAGGAA